MSCPCDSCKYKKLNYQKPNNCPNFEYFFDAMMKAYDGVLKEDPCDKWEKEENDSQYLMFDIPQEQDHCQIGDYDYH